MKIPGFSTLIGTQFEVRSKDGDHPVWRHPRHRDYESACDRADEVGGYVIDMNAVDVGNDVVYMSRKYQKRNPFGGKGADDTPRGDGVEPYWAHDPFEGVDV